ncbi:MAG: NAD(P)H-dependent oxidoreductase [Bacteroidales bacterium]|nr:NAD(P)H-dependent oxidoreductase [Bacteroidales bacterium]MBN2821175.1 NAD(P)H-dependent oxidoreductase [Bacteroidales bacterium]
MLFKKKISNILEYNDLKDLYIKKLHKRYATKSFSRRNISESDIEILKKIISLSPSSYGLQPYQFIIIKDQDIKDQLFNASFNQSQVKDCSHLIVLCAKQTINEQDITEYINLMSETRKVNPNSLSGFKGMIQKNVATMTDKEQCHWASKQAYLALGNLLSACALFDIDACPMETFQTEKFDTILQLEQKGLTASVLAALGYRTKLDSHQYKKKVRKPTSQLFIDI